VSQIYINMLKVENTPENADWAHKKRVRRGIRKG
jgi:hypothetical protein